ncbi:unnamed protein product [Leuciscus chuanchicus]
MINWPPASALRHPRATEQDAAAAETGQSGDELTPSQYPCASLPPELLVIFTRDSLRPCYGAHGLISFSMSDDDEYDLRRGVKPDPVTQHYCTTTLLSSTHDDDSKTVRSVVPVSHVS